MGRLKRVIYLQGGSTLKWMLEREGGGGGGTEGECTVVVEGGSESDAGVQEDRQSSGCEIVP